MVNWNIKLSGHGISVSFVFCVFFLSQEAVFNYGFNLFNSYKNWSGFLNFLFVLLLQEIFVWMCSFSSLCVHFTYIIKNASLQLCIIHMIFHIYLHHSTFWWIFLWVPFPFLTLCHKDPNLIHQKCFNTFKL